MKTPFAASLVLLAAALCLPARADDASVASAHSETISAILKRGTLLVGNEGKFPTLNFKDPVTGAHQGFMADLARALAKRLLGDESKVEFVEVNDDTRLPSVASGAIDVVIDTTPFSQEKAKLVDASDETFRSGSGFLVRKGSPIRTIDDIKAGTRVLWVSANPDVSIIKAKAPDAVYIEFSKSGDAFAALKAGKGDAFTQVVTHLFRAAYNDHDFTVVGRFTTKPYAILFKKGDTGMRDYLNEFIHSLRASGEYDRLYEKSFGPYGGDAVR